MTEKGESATFILIFHISLRFAGSVTPLFGYATFL